MRAVAIRHWSLILLVLMPALSVAEPASLEATQAIMFKKLIAESGLQFAPPEDFTDIEPQANPILPYERALRHQSGELEMRLIIRPLGRISIDYNDPHNASPEPNHLFPLLFESLMNELSRGGGKSHNSEYPQSQAKKLFNAGWASAAVFDVNPDFSDEYSQALLIAIHKNGLADAYTVFLYNESAQAKIIIQNAVNSLSFVP